MGALGWVHFGLLDDRFPEAVNLGVQDQVAALKWVHEHIAGFGGDPSNITIGGESCGATAISHLLALPEVQPFIKRAVIQSLSPFNMWCTQQQPEASVVAETYVKMRGLFDPLDLMKVDPERLVAVHSVLSRLWPADANVAWRPLGPVAKNGYSPFNPVDYLSEGKYLRDDFELIIGFAKDEWKFFRGHSATMPNGTKEDVLAVLRQVFDDRAESVYDAYELAQGSDNAPSEILSAVMSMEFFKFSSLLIAENFAAQGKRVFVFQFSYDLPGQNGRFRAIHTADTPFIFHNLERHRLQRNPPFEGVDFQEIEAVSTNISGKFGAFIRSGNPGNEWPCYEASSRSIPWFGKTVEARPGLRCADASI